MEELETLTILKTKDIKTIKQMLLEKQGYRCAICGKELTLENSVLDHQHKQRKSDRNGVNGDGLVRGVICQEDNLSEGKIWNSTGRFQGARTPQDRINWLRNLIKYYEQEKYPYIHPTEKPAQKILSKKNFNIVAKLYKQKFPKRKLLVYPKSKHLTGNLRKIFDMFKISYYNEDTNSTR